MPTNLEPKSFAGHKILVAGEAILDRYQQGNAERISREAPVPVITTSLTSSRCGGAANTAANIAAIDSKATLIAICGDDQPGQELANICGEANISAKLIVNNNIKTAVKTRVMVSGQQLLRIDECHKQSALAKNLAKEVIKNLDDHAVVVLSDYGLGALNNADEIIAKAREKKIPVVIDPRGSDWSKYKGASLITPNFGEFENVNEAGSQDEKAYALLKRFNIDAMLLTQGSKGMTLYQQGQDPINLTTRTIDVFDVTGAGDTVVAFMAMSIAAKANLEDAARWANLAAGISVSKLGTATISAAELITPPGGHGGKIVTISELVTELENHRSKGKNIVMTNGCFDIFHAGHLESLANASRLGDILIVCINDDGSVAKLKGDSRPVIPLEERIQVIAGLGCVDYVVSFSATDAVDMVKKIKPSIYVKGGDWANNPPQEAIEAEKLGGKTVYQTSRPHISTSAIIEKVLKNNG